MIKVGVLFFQMVSVSQVSVDHHLRELSGKTSLPRLRDTICGMPFFLLHLIARTLTLAVIAAYSREALVATVATLMILNLCYVYCGLASTANKAVFTVTASVLVPICFMTSKRAKALGQAVCSKRFYHYYLWNTVSFAAVSTAALILPFLLLPTPDDCDSMPVFLCAPSCRGRTSFCLFNEGNSVAVSHAEYVTILMPSLILLNLICIHSVFLMRKGKVLMKY